VKRLLHKIHNNIDYLEDFGIKTKDEIYLFENGIVKVSDRFQLSPVVRINALWMERDATVKCEIASTLKEKRVGLSKHSKLGEQAGMFFPYPGGASVSFHQGGVTFPLDVIFLKNSFIVQMERDTDMTSDDSWVCADCDSVIEVNGGFCEDHDIVLGDIVVYSAVSEADLYETTLEASVNSSDSETTSSFMTAISDLI